MVWNPIPGWYGFRTPYQTKTVWFNPVIDIKSIDTVWFNYGIDSLSSLYIDTYIHIMLQIDIESIDVVNLDLSGLRLMAKMLHEINFQRPNFQFP